MDLAGLFQKLEAATEDKARLELLNDLKTITGTLSRAEMTEQLNAVNLEVLFRCLESDNANPEPLHSTCEILKGLMNVLDPVATLDKYHAAIKEGFEHPFPEVPGLIITHLSRAIDQDEGCLGRFSAMREAALQALVSEDLGVAQQADRLIAKYGKTVAGSAYFLSSEAVQIFSKMLEGDYSSTKKFRVYDAITQIATLSRDHFQAMNEGLGMMDKLIFLSFKSSDWLGQATALEVIANLAGCAHGQDALRNAGVFQEIRQVFGNLAEGMQASLFLPGIVKFVGKVGVVSLPPEDMIDMVMRVILDSEKEFALKTTAAEAFAHIGGTVEGKQYYKNKVTANTKLVFQKIREIIFEAPTEFKTRALVAMSFLFGSDEANEDVLPYWFNVVVHDVSELFELVRLPFPEMRIAGLNFMASIAHLEWAQRHYLTAPGVIEFLISREPEPVKECVYAKYRLVKIIVDSPSTTKILSPDNLAQLKVYVHQGPFYSPAESAVATEGAGP